MSEYAAEVTWTHDGAVATVGLRGRTRLNVLGREAIGEATRALGDVASGEAVRCIVLEGAGGGVFIGGADIREMRTLTPESARTFITELHGLCAAIMDAPVPVIAKVRGYALGAGMEVAAACDIRICEPGARWGMPEVRVGLPSVIEAALLPELIGWGPTANLLLRGHTFDAAEALRVGLVAEVVSATALDAAVEAAVRDVLRCGPLAVRRQKQLLRAWRDASLDESIASSIDGFAEAFETDEPREGLSAFLEKRPARYVAGD